MLRSVKGIHGYSIQATDGDIGAVYAFYFDDDLWTVRYLVVDTGTWLPGRRVLLSPTAIGQIHWETETVTVTLSREQVENSPDMDTEKPVSRQYETALHNYYGWPMYWGAFEPTGAGVMAMPPPALEVAESAENMVEAQGDPHLRSTHEVMGYSIHAWDGDIGSVRDFIVEDELWAIRYMVVDTGHWLPGKKVLIAPPWITEVSWGESKVYVELTQEEVKNSPEFDAAAPVNRAYEERLYDFYGRPKYWL
jgi:hypothetical protein